MLQLTSFSDSAGLLVVTLGRGARRGCGLVVARDRVLTLSRSLGRETIELGFGGEVRSASTRARDARTGLSLLEVATGEVEPVSFSDRDPAIGDPVVALGDPGSGLRVTEGRVAAAHVELRSRSGRALHAIEHTAPVPRGTGGGPVLDAGGALAGINVLRGDPGFVIALAGSVVQAAVQRLERGAPQPPRLGVAVAPSHVARRLRGAVGLEQRDGVLVRDVEEGSPAALAGLRAGDLIVALGAQPVGSIDDLHASLESSVPAATVGAVRGAEELELALDLSRSGA